MERWIFLGRERGQNIEQFSYDLRDTFGKDFWNFSRFVPNNVARQPVAEGYSLDDCFKQRKKMQDPKLIIGQEFFGKPSIRLAFRQVDIWADFILEYTEDRYVKTGELFVRNFNHTIDTYPHQHQI
jgi:hypothetical protein